MSTSPPDTLTHPSQRIHGHPARRRVTVVGTNIFPDRGQPHRRATGDPGRSRAHTTACRPKCALTTKPGYCLPFDRAARVTEQPGQPARTAAERSAGEGSRCPSLATDLGMGGGICAALACWRFGSARRLTSMRHLSQVFYTALLRFVGCMADAPAAETFGDEKATCLATPRSIGPPLQHALALLRHQGAGLAPAAAPAGLLRRWRTFAPLGHGHGALRGGSAPGGSAGLAAPSRTRSGRSMSAGRACIPRRLRGEEVALAMRMTLLAGKVVSPPWRSGGGSGRRGAERSWCTTRAVRDLCEPADNLLAGITAEALGAVLATEPAAPRHLSEATLTKH